MNRQRALALTGALLVLAGVLWLAGETGRLKEPSQAPHAGNSPQEKAADLAAVAPAEAGMTGLTALTAPASPVQPLPRGPNQSLVFPPVEEVRRAPVAGKVSPVQVFAARPGPPAGPLTMNRHVRSAIEAGFDAAAVPAFTDSDAAALAIPLREDLNVVVEVSQVLRRGPRTHTLVGKVRGEPLSDVLLAFHDGAVGGNVSFLDRNDHYEFGLAGNGGVAIRRLDPTTYDAPCGVTEMEEAGADRVDENHETAPAEEMADAGGMPPNFSSAENAGEEASGNVATMDIVVGYDIKARQSDGGVAGIESRIIASVDRMNTAFTNSLVTGVRAVLLGTIEDPDYVFPGAISGNIGSADELGRLNNETDGHLDTVSNFRKALGADQNTFVINDADGAAGVAFLPGRAAVVARTYMTSTRITFAHEFGHNLGARHSWGDSGSDLSKTINQYGWRLKPPDGAAVRTIMAYDWGWGNGARIPHFSNPHVLYAGARTGAVNGYNATGDSTTDPRYVSGGYIGTAGTGFNGSNPQLGANVAACLLANAPAMAARSVRIANPAPQIVSLTTAAAVVGQPFSHQIITLHPANSFNATRLPPGLSINVVTGEITGTPEQPGVHVVSLTATGDHGSGGAKLTLTIDKAAQRIEMPEYPPQWATDTLALTATGGASGNLVVFSVVYGPAVLGEGDVLRFTTSGSVLLRASQAGNDLYHAAPDATQILTINKSPVVVELLNLTQYYDGTPRVVTSRRTPDAPVLTRYNGLSTPPVQAGSYVVKAHVHHPLHGGEAEGILTVLRPRIALEELDYSDNDADGRLDFGWTVPGNTARRLLRVRNTGTGVLDPVTLSFETGSSKPGFFQCDPISLDGIGPGQSASIEVTYRPLARGRHESVLRLTSNDVSRPAVNVELSGNADHRTSKPVSEPDEDAGTTSELAASSWPDAAAGNYAGLLRDGDDGWHLLGACDRVTVSRAPPGSDAGGAASGRLRIQGRTLRWRGQFNAAGELSLIVSPAGLSTTLLQFTTLKDQHDQHALQALVSWDSKVAEGTLARAAFDTRLRHAPPEWTGRYTMLLPSQSGWENTDPGGDGYGTVIISLGGVMRSSGRLGDGAAFTCSTHLSGEGVWCLYDEPYRTKNGQRGRWGGRVTLRDLAAVSDFDGQMQWWRPPNPRARRYPSGFEVTQPVLGSRLTVPPQGTRLLTQLEAGPPNALLSLIEDSLPSGSVGQVIAPVDWRADNTLRGAGSLLVRGGTRRGNGLWSGHSQGGGLKWLFRGVVFQKQNLAAGQFFNGPVTGAARLRPLDKE